MATFGSIPAVQLNPLLDMASIDRAAQGYQRNALALEGAQREMADDTAFRELAPRVVAGDRDALGQAMGVNPGQTTQLMAGMAAMARPEAEARKAAAAERTASFEALQGIATVLSGLPEDQQESAYNQVRDLHRQHGIKVPDIYPGAAAARIMADLSLTPAERADRLRNTYSPAGNNAPGVYPAARGGTLNVPPELVPHYEAAAKATGVPIEVLLAKDKQESDFGRVASRPGDGQGVAQVLNSTARSPGYGMQGVDPAVLRDPAANIMFGAQYLASKSREMGVTDWNDPAQRAKGLAGYNGGGDPNYVANVSRYLPDAPRRVQVAASQRTATDAAPGVMPDRNQLGEYDTRAAPAGMGWAMVNGVRTAVPLPGAPPPPAAEAAAARMQAREDRLQDREERRQRDERDFGLRERQLAATSQKQAVQQARMAPPLQKAEDEDLDAISSAAGLRSDMGVLQDQIRTGKLEFGPISNQFNAGRNAIGLSSEESRNFATFQATVERIRNESLRLNKGVQTEGDAQRAANELVASINDPAIVQQRLAELMALNERAIGIRNGVVQQRRTNAGLPGLDTGSFASQPAALDARPEPVPSAQAAPATNRTTAQQPAAAQQPAQRGRDVPWPVKTDADYLNLQPGQLFIAPDGTTRRKS